MNPRKPQLTHRVLNALGVFLLFCLPLSAQTAEDQAPPDPAQIRAEIDAAEKAGDLPKAITAAQTLAQVYQELEAEALYKAAVLEARSGKTEDAFKSLQAAFDAYLPFTKELVLGTDFPSLKGQDRYKKMVKKYRTKIYIEMLERPERDSFQKPAEIMAALALKPGERVADVGAGSGYFTRLIAKAVGSKTKVLAVDINPDILEYLGKRMADEGITNVELKQSTKDDPQLPPTGLDTVFLVDTIHYVKDMVPFIQKLKAGLVPGGRLVIIDYNPKSWAERPWGPAPEDQLAREKLDEAMKAAGLTPKKVHTFLPEQYFVEYGVETK